MEDNSILEWHYDSETGTVFVKFRSGIEVTLEAFQEKLDSLIATLHDMRPRILSIVFE